MTETELTQEQIDQLLAWLLETPRLPEAERTALQQIYAHEGASSRWLQAMQHALRGEMQAVEGEIAELDEGMAAMEAAATAADAEDKSEEEAALQAYTSQTAANMKAAASSAEAAAVELQTGIDQAVQEAEQGQANAEADEIRRQLGI